MSLYCAVSWSSSEPWEHRRLRGTKEHSPGSSAALYYGQRAEAPGTLIISESALVSEKSGTFPGVTLIKTDEQIAGWKTVSKRTVSRKRLLRIIPQVVDTVHANGSFIYLQLGAVGRPGAINGTASTEVLGASDIPLTGLPTPRPLTLSEIKEFTESFATSAYNAVHKAGFDGVEVHGGKKFQDTLKPQLINPLTTQQTDI